jgi:para-aminobenzoate synthetase component 1
MLSWSNQFSIFLFLDSNGYLSAHSRFECLLAVNPVARIRNSEPDCLDELSSWQGQEKDWLFGHINYDYKNALEPRLVSHHVRKLGFPDIEFFCPQIVCYIEKDKKSISIECFDVSPADVFETITGEDVQNANELPELSFSQRVDQQDYLTTINLLRQHIADGDCYEINYCCEGFCAEASIQPLAVYNKLCGLSPAPFAAYYRLEDKYMMCASPERYLMKEGQTVRSQPIKGTARRDIDTDNDKKNKELLRESAKDRAENVMIVDLVRNDLARSCETGSVEVEELFGIYSFPQVHQMISTVSGKLNANGPYTDAIRHSFPMGSMTGAPKIKVMELIEQFEQSRRELFSGTVGYITPEGDFDFNVIIRSLFYNASTKYLSYQAGGAITYDSDPQQEWEEMRLKAWALEKLFARG